MAAEILIMRGIDPALSLGKNWVDGFLRRHPNLRTIYTEILEAARAAASSPETISGWLERLERRRAENGWLREDIWNFDEKGVQAGDIHRRVVIVRKEHSATDRQRRQPGDRTLLTLIEAISAAGEIIPPFVILKTTLTTLEWTQANITPIGKYNLLIAPLR